jgi:PAS domain S-box-containing protein
MDDTFFRELVARSRDAIISIDADSEILFTSDGVERVLGYDPEALEGESLTTVMPERFQETHMTAVDRYLSEGERNLDWDDIELPAEHADGHEVPLSIVFEEHEYRGEPVFSGIMRDISDRIEREEQLERQNEQLEQFASVVSHDLRDPLNTAKATLTLLEAAADGEADVEEYVDDIGSTLDRMEELVEDVLALTRGGRALGETELVSLERVAGEAWTIAGADAATLAVGAGAPTIEADAGRLQALLENLFRNAAEHNADDGIEVTVGALPGGEGFYVADDGAGIPDGDREVVFEPGHTTDDEGTGLGLDIVRTVAEAHGWTVELTESEGGGARFEFETGA